MKHLITKTLKVILTITFALSLLFLCAEAEDMGTQLLAFIIGLGTATFSGLGLSLLGTFKEDAR